MNMAEEKKETKEAVESGVHNYTEEEAYVWPENPAVREHLEWFRGLKLGFMMHWAPVSQLGSDGVLAPLRRGSGLVPGGD